jgi:hypothetical protein
MRRHRSEGYGINLSSLPKSKTEAEKVGSTYFYTGKPCANGHRDARYTKGGNCCWCTRAKSAAKYGNIFNGKSSRALVNAARAAASNRGELTYVSPKPCRFGHTIRWVASTNCVECDRDARKRHKESIANARIKKLYGVSAEDHEKIFVKQKKSCAICRTKFKHRRQMHVDHCHKSKRVRGLLCSKCNQAIGLFGDSAKLMLRATEYVNDDTPILSARGN